MKSIVVREIISLVLKPSSPSSSTVATSTTSTNKHLRFTSPEPGAKSNSQSKPPDKKPRSVHAQYYSTITFNQIVLTSSQTDRQVAVQLIDIYFELFKDVLGAEPEKAVEPEEGNEKALEKDGGVRKDKIGRVLVKDKKGKGKKGKEVHGAAGFVEVEDSNSKLISALLTGVNRALPFAKVETGDTKCVSSISPSRS